MATDASERAIIGLPSELCRQFEPTIEREWLVTNGIGGYAMGTVNGANARAYHGYLVAATVPPVGRTLLCQHLAETLTIDGVAYDLSCNEWQDGTVWPHGFRYLEHFSLDGTLPVWHYRVGSVVLEKRVWMVAGHNATMIRYRLLAGAATLTVAIAVNDRDHHAATVADGRDWMIMPNDDGWQIMRPDGSGPWHLAVTGGNFTPNGRWESGLQLRVEAERGLGEHEDRYHLGTVAAALTAGQPLVLQCATAAVAAPVATLAAAKARESGLLTQAALTQAALPIQQLVLAADQFIVARPASAVADAATVIAGYPWFGDWGRDTMIALPGLCLATRRFKEARAILLTFAQFISQGMLPNRFPDIGEQPEYNTVDATLWYFDATARYIAASGDEAILHTLYPLLAEIVSWHQRGTRYGIGVDPDDGLLRAGVPGAQLTWMDVRIDDLVVTPRHGKAVEINALWYRALTLMAAWAASHGTPTECAAYQSAAAAVQTGYQRFWNEATGCLYDVLDTPLGDDATIRPNQVLALSVAPELLSVAQRQAVLTVVGRWLVTPVGLRTLDPRDPAYRPRFTGDRYARDTAYHQGTVWPWLIGHYVTARRALEPTFDPQPLLQPCFDQLWEGGLGTLAEVYDGDPPRHGAGCLAQAWSVSELLRVAIMP